MRRACSRRAVHINVPARSLPAGPPSFPSPSPPLPAARACSAPLPHASVQVLIHAADGTLLQRFRPCEHALGVKCFVWSPTAHLLALASARDLRVRLLNSLTWQRVAEFDLGAGELTEHRTADAGATARPPPLPPSSPPPLSPLPSAPHTRAYFFGSSLSLPHLHRRPATCSLSLSPSPRTSTPAFPPPQRCPPLCTINPVLTTNHPPAASASCHFRRRDSTWPRVTTSWRTVSGSTTPVGSACTPCCPSRPL